MPVKASGEEHMITGPTACQQKCGMPVICVIDLYTAAGITILKGIILLLRGPVPLLGPRARL